MATKNQTIDKCENIYCSNNSIITIEAIYSDGKSKTINDILIEYLLKKAKDSY